jgi:anti-sigma regulatory factor (Ser/Thr protein kinase)
VGEEVFVEEQVNLAPGNLLALYTDGLVESRERDIDEGINQLTEVLVAGTGSLEERCDEVLERLGRRSGIGDDVALLLVRLPPESDRRTPAARMHVPRGIQSVAQARAFCTRLFTEWGLSEEVASAALLVVNELVTNALVHGRAPLELLLRRTATRLYVEVVDGSGHLPRRRLAGYDDEGGRGLHLVAALSERWGVRPAGEGKAVWAAMVLTPQADRQFV